MTAPHSSLPKEDRGLFESYRDTGCEETRDMLLQRYDYLPQILARRFTGRGIEYDDIYQSARIGLINALSRFIPEKGVRFVTFATPTIIGEIKRLFRDKGNVIKVPRKLYEIFNKANKIKNARLLKDGAELSVSELAELTGVSEELMSESLEWGDNHFVRSLEQAVYNSDETLFSNLVGMEDDHFLMIENKDFIKTFMDTLTSRERQFVKLRYYDGLTQDSIARRLNISQMNVSRMERRVLSELKQMYFEAVNS